MAKNNYVPPASNWVNRPRTHKSMTFQPVMRSSKRRIKSVLTAKNNELDGRLCDKRYYRIYKHKGQRYTLYLGPEKYSHGGLRHRPKVKGSTETSSLIEEKKISNPYYSQKLDLTGYQKITFGPHEGKYLDMNTGDILTEEQIRYMEAKRGLLE